MRGPKQSAERVWVRRSRSSGAGIRAHGRVERSGVRTPHHLLNGAWLSVGDQCRRDPAVGVIVRERRGSGRAWCRGSTNVLFRCCYMVDLR